MSWARCPKCDRTFGSDSGFERHQIRMTGQPGWDPDYDWRCATPDEMKARGLHRDRRGWWRRDGVSGPRVRTESPAGAAERAESEAEDRHLSFLHWAEQDRREDSRYADEEPRP